MDMDTVAGTNWVALASLISAMILQAAALGWWLSRKLATHELALANAVSTEREARTRSISEHARVVAIDIEQAKAEARSAKEQVQLVRTEIATAFRLYPTREELRQMLSDRLDPIQSSLEKLLSPALSARKRTSK